MALALGAGAVLATALGGVFALTRQDRLHLVLGFSAGAVLGVALFDLLPESFELATTRYQASTVALAIGLGFFTFALLNRAMLLHPETDRHGALGAGSLSLHSF